jgi:peptidoglycan/LPS O-acetylase OafA/YrhL
MTRQLSLYLDLLRFLAAFAVYISHASYFAKAKVPFVGDFGSEAVIVFFVLSGLLIAMATRKQVEAGAFVQARLSRLWSVCLPALVLTLMADIAGQYLSLDSYHPMQPFSAFKWAASIGMNALFLNQVWYLNVFPGTNGPFWSLSYEFWYYMITAAVVYCKGSKRVAAVAIVMLIAGPLILLAFPVWLFGVVLYFAVRRSPVDQVGRGWAVWLGSCAAAFAFSYFDLNPLLKSVFPSAAAAARWGVDFWPVSYIAGAIVATNIYGFALMGNILSAPLEKISTLIRFGANISFGLYLFHYPLMYLIRAVLTEMGIRNGGLFIAVVYAAPFALAAFLALKCERHKAIYSGIIEVAFAFVSTRRVRLFGLAGVGDSRAHEWAESGDEVLGRSSQ